MGSCHLSIVNVYSWSGNIMDNLQAYCHSLLGPSLILGDFNLHYPFWIAPAATHASADFVDWLNTSSFSIINSFEMTHIAPNGRHTLLDLSICSFAFLSWIDFCVEKLHLAVIIFQFVLSWTVLELIMLLGSSSVDQIFVRKWTMPLAHSPISIILLFIQQWLGPCFIIVIGASFPLTLLLHGGFLNARLCFKKKEVSSKFGYSNVFYRSLDQV